MKKIVGYRAYQCLTDDNGKVVHKTPIGWARTERGIRALIAGYNCPLPISVEPIYAE